MCTLQPCIVSAGGDLQHAAVGGYIAGPIPMRCFEKLPTPMLTSARRIRSA